MPHQNPESFTDTGIGADHHVPTHIANQGRKRAVIDAALRAAKPESKPYKIAAGGGLYLEVMPGGSKLWRLKYRLDGKENRYSMGSYLDLPLKEARELSGAARKLVKKGFIRPCERKLIGSNPFMNRPIPLRPSPESGLHSRTEKRSPRGAGWTC